MTKEEFEQAPIGTLHYWVKANINAIAPWSAFRATMWEMTHEGVEIRIFYGATYADAQGKASAYLKERGK